MSCYPYTLKAVATLKGSIEAPSVRGSVSFYQKPCGILVVANVTGLPKTNKDFLGFHIHEGNSCGGVNFSDSKSHYNPFSTPHPKHAGDMPPLLLCGNSAYLAFLTCRFKLSDIIGRTVIIHDMPDDFTTQPSGNAGTKIACGVIKRRVLKN